MSKTKSCEPFGDNSHNIMHLINRATSTNTQLDEYDGRNDSSDVAMETDSDSNISDTTLSAEETEYFCNISNSSRFSKFREVKNEVHQFIETFDHERKM